MKTFFDLLLLNGTKVGEISSAYWTNFFLFCPKIYAHKAKNMSARIWLAWINAFI